MPGLLFSKVSVLLWISAHFMMSLSFGRLFFCYPPPPATSPPAVAAGKPDLLPQRCQWPVELSGHSLFFEWCCCPCLSSGFQSCALLGPAPGSLPGSAPWTSAPLSWARTSGWTWTPPGTEEGGMCVVVGVVGPLSWECLEIWDLACH